MLCECNKKEVCYKITTTIVEVETKSETYKTIKEPSTTIKWMCDICYLREEMLTKL